jgi:hydroxymethylglutaryl-CoA lyase
MRPADGVDSVQIVEVGPRDGLQMIDTLVPTSQKVALLRGLHRAGLRRIEIGSFASAAALPQLADVRELLAVAKELPGLDGQVLVATARRGVEAVAAGARHLVFVMSVSEKHNARNVHRTPRESIVEYARLVESIPAETVMRVNVATAFDCPFDGPVAEDSAVAVVSELAEIRPNVEIALCDTTGRVTPDAVSHLFRACFARMPQVEGWAFHGHDTYGMGIANVVAAWHAGVEVIDASFGGLGGCPFAPGATGNVATEDTVWMFERLGVRTGVDLDALLTVAQEAARLPGAIPGGRVREALAAARRREMPS